MPSNRLGTIHPLELWRSSYADWIVLMTINVTNPSALSDNFNTKPQVKSTEQISSFRGSTVARVIDPTAVLADALEELTFSMSETTSTDAIKKHNVSTGAKSFAMEQANRYLEQVPDINDQQQLTNWAKEVSKMPANQSKQK